MGKTIFVLTDNNRNPISDSVVVTITKTTSPFTIYTGTKIPSGGNNNGARVFADVTDGDYTVKYDAVIQDDLSPLHIAGPGTIVSSTVGVGEILTIHIADLNVTEAKIANAAITANKIASSAITAAKIAAGAIDASSLASSSVSKAKLNSDVFSSIMEDVSGWGPKVDNLTITKSSGSLKVPANGITANEINNDAVINTKIQDGAVSTSKLAAGAVGSSQLGDDSVTAGKVQNNAIITDKISDGNITEAKIADAAVTENKIFNNSIGSEKLKDDSVTQDKIAAGAVTLENLETSLKNSLLVPPSKIAFVSPQFSDNVGPYFDNIPDAYTYIDGEKGTILLYPGTYTSPILIGDSVNLIGLDKTRCILQIDPPASTPYGIKIEATSDKQILIKNLTLRVEPSATLGTTVSGIWLDSTGSNYIRIEDTLIFVHPSSHPSTPDDAIGINVNSSLFRFERSSLQIYGANFGTGTDGGDSYGIYLNGTSTGVISDCQISVRGKGSVSDIVCGIYWTNSSQNIDTINCTIEVTDYGSATEYSFQAGAAVTVLVMNSLYSKNAHSNITVTSIGSVMDNNVIIKDSF